MQRETVGPCGIREDPSPRLYSSGHRATYGRTGQHAETGASGELKAEGKEGLITGRRPD
jgi:hypothetical protein